MARSKSALPKNWSIGDLLKHFGGIAPERIRIDPARQGDGAPRYRTR